jgi:hypothetical protein
MKTYGGVDVLTKLILFLHGFLSLFLSLSPKGPLLSFIFPICRCFPRHATLRKQAGTVRQTDGLTDVWFILYIYIYMGHGIFEVVPCWCGVQESRMFPSATVPFVSPLLCAQLQIAFGIDLSGMGHYSDAEVCQLDLYQTIWNKW